MSDHDPLDKWRHRVDRQLGNIENEVRNHPGIGKPLNLGNDPNVPHEMQMAFKILAENDLTPDWIATGKALEQKSQRLLHALQRAAEDYRAARFANSAAVWQSQLKSFRQQFKDYNDEVLSYNLKVPTGINHRTLLNLDREIKRLLGR